MFCVTRSQVTVWAQNKDSIFVCAKGAGGKRSRIRAKRGRFSACEAAVFAQLLKERKLGRQVGPKWIRQAMLRAVERDQPLGWRLFTARAGWLSRFARRHKLALRRKTNVKRVPIQDRVPLLQRYFAMFRLYMKSFHKQVGYHPVHSVFNSWNRWSLDQVPAGLFDPKTTYEVKGATHVHIAANGSADGHRICTLQVLCRNRIVPDAPRRGQPRLCVIFRGTGKRISAAELAEYHADVHVMWQPKAWADATTSNRYVVDYCVDEICKAELEPGTFHLVTCDNLGSQTKKQNPQFSALLDKLCNAKVWNVLAGNTDEVQVVDAGLGAHVKRKAEEIQTEWLRLDKNWEEWTAGTLSAGRKRILLTHWFGKAWEQACETFDFCKVFTNCGTNLLSLIHI
eukprot:TRINITY_DN4526_c0_g1_i2.p1 TRINITY_DN4526_c0_g1~~TRINITY_DN4526_c0_g1_i2.p1  ORF type:complete len:397 (-),score=39.76 TRINITY_DN4526_c0_g1_i2:153-1343(-)